MYNEDKECAIEGITFAMEKARALKARNSRELTPEAKRSQARREYKARQCDADNFQGDAVNRSRNGRWK